RVGRHKAGPTGRLCLARGVALFLPPIKTPLRGAAFLSDALPGGQVAGLEGFGYRESDVVFASVAVVDIGAGVGHGGVYAGDGTARRHAPVGVVRAVSGFIVEHGVTHVQGQAEVSRQGKVITRKQIGLLSGFETVLGTYGGVIGADTADQFDIIIIVGFRVSVGSQGNVERDVIIDGRPIADVVV